MSEFNTGINDFLAPKLIFVSSKKTQDFSYYSASLEKECDIRDQHILFYRSKKSINVQKTKKSIQTPEGDLRHK